MNSFVMALRLTCANAVARRGMGVNRAQCFLPFSPWGEGKNGVLIQIRRNLLQVAWASIGWSHDIRGSNGSGSVVPFRNLPAVAAALSEITVETVE
jgi:hypothetical protein